MAYTIDFSLATSAQIEAALCSRVERIRLSRNITQAQLAKEAGVSMRTIGRLAKGEGVSLDTFVRVLMALGIEQSLQTILPDPSVQPIERIETGGSIRKRARPREAPGRGEAWTWGEGGDTDE